MPTSSNSNNLYGRKWNVSIGMGSSGTTIGSSSQSLLNVSSSSFIPEALRVVFKGGGVYNEPMWFGEVEIYNLSVSTMQSIYAAFQQDGATSGAMRVVITAGYQNSQFGKVFDMKVYQILVERRDVTDWILTLRCVNSLDAAIANFTSAVINGGYTNTQLITTMMKSCSTEVPIGGITKNIGQQKMSRGRTIFGDPKSYLRDISQDDKVTKWWFDENKLWVSSPLDMNSSSALVI